jgi:hypothetical protein
MKCSSRTEESARVGSQPAPLASPLSSSSKHLISNLQFLFSPFHHQPTHPFYIDSLHILDCTSFSEFQLALQLSALSFVSRDQIILVRSTCCDLGPRLQIIEHLSLPSRPPSVDFTIQPEAPSFASTETCSRAHRSARCSELSAPAGQFKHIPSSFSRVPDSTDQSAEHAR